MGKTNRQGNFASLWFLVLLLIVGAWLLPSSIGLASSAVDNVRVKVKVVDVVSVNVGKSAVNKVSGPGGGQIVTEFVTRAAPAQLGSSQTDDKTQAHGDSGMKVLVPVGHCKSGIDSYGAVPGDEPFAMVNASAIMVTVSRL